MVCRRTALACSLVVLSSFPSVAARGSDDVDVGTIEEIQQKARVNWSELNDDDGRTPCEMQARVEETCSKSTRRARASRSMLGREDPPSQPSQCLCTNLYFNLWSACLACNMSGTPPPKSDDWRQDCSSNGHQIEDIGSDSAHGNYYPQWAYATLPDSGKSWDVVAALAATPNNQTTWEPIQIILPVVVVVAALFAVAFLYYWLKLRKKSPTVSASHADSRAFMRSMFPNVRPVRQGTRDTAWMIDGAREQENATFISATTASGHVRLPSSPGPQPPPSTSQSIGRGWHAFLSFVTPWKSRPRAVRNMGVRRSIDIDRMSQGRRSGKTESTLENYRFGGWPLRAKNVGRKISTTGDDDSDMESPLIETRRRPDSIILVSRDNLDFSMESGDNREINVIPPEPSPSLERLEPLRPNRSPPPHYATPPTPHYPPPFPPASPDRRGRPQDQMMLDRYPARPGHRPEASLAAPPMLHTRAASEDPTRTRDRSATREHSPRPSPVPPFLHTRAYSEGQNAPPYSALASSTVLPLTEVTNPTPQLPPLIPNRRPDPSPQQEQHSSSSLNFLDRGRGKKHQNSSSSDSQGVYPQSPPGAFYHPNRG